MRKIFFMVLALTLIFESSCNKGNSATDAGSWILHSNTFKGAYALFVTGSLTASTGTSNPSGSIAFYFYDSTSNATLDSLAAQYKLATNRDTAYPRPSWSWPPKLGSYTITNTYQPDSGYVYVQLTDTAQFNSYHITGSSTPQVTVNRVGNKITVSFPPVMMVNKNSSSYPTIGLASGTDSSLVSATIKQTQ